jgi:Xaa-Pro aminopeptidase
MHRGDKIMKNYALVVCAAFALLFVLDLPRAAAEPLPGYVTPPAPVFSDSERQAELARRRSEVAAKMSDKSILILFSAEPKLYTNDVDYVFRQENNLYYLTALKQAGSALVIAKDGPTIREFIFLPKRNPQFETWNGRMYSNEDASTLSGIKTIIASSELPQFLQALKEKRPFRTADASVESGVLPQNIYLLLPDSPQDRDGAREFRVEEEFSRSLSGFKVENAQPIFAELRHIKSAYEQKLLQHAIDITTEAQMRAMAAAGRAKMEYEVQAEVEYIFRKRNADFWGYPSIVGCGPNATTLHYEEASGPVKPGDLLLMDVGAEYDHYSADVTRTFPINGKFTKEQADIYRIVYDAQEAVAKAAKPGATMSDLGEAAASVIKDGLFKLGLITDKNSRQYGIFYMHGFGHWLGMNVHDVGRYGAPLRPGMTFTNEPGIYIREDALNYLPDTPESKAFIAKVGPAFEKYKNIGVRIEDDMLITDTGVVWMTRDLPRKLEDVESYISKARPGFPFVASRTGRKKSVIRHSSLLGSAFASEFFARRTV